MLKLKGSTLGKRQQELNEEVIKTTSKNIDFSVIANLEEQCDIDRLYKIDVASVYKNTEYIIETLKSGDSLYVSRALKCSWLYDDSFIINPHYLHQEVFSFMSNKMQKKMLTTISMHIHDENRAEDFYKYCVIDQKLKNLAHKFLIKTSEQYKIDYISNNYIKDIIKLKHIIGDSFNVAEAYLAKEKRENRNTNKKVHALRYLIKISDEKYLDIMEAYTDLNIEAYNQPTIPKLGLRLSKYVITKHKERVFNNLQIYLNKLNIDVIKKQFSIEDIKQSAVLLLPPTASDFWYVNFYFTYKKLFDVFPQNEAYVFLKSLFATKYPDEPFEMSRNFYDLSYYKLLTNKERETWALDNLKHNPEFFGSDRDYIWYQFVNYEEAFKQVKKYISLCTGKYERSAMVNILVDSVNNEEEVEKLLRYYYERHANECEDNKKTFIHNLSNKFNIFKFGESCWDALNKILYSTKKFHDGDSYPQSEYKTFIILYHIAHDKEIPKGLEDYVMRIPETILYDNAILDKFTADQINLIYQKLITLCIDKLMYFDTQSYVEVLDKTNEIVICALKIRKIFEKTKDDCPDIIMKYVNSNWTHFERYFVNNENEITEAKLLKMLKQDSKLLLEKLPEFSDFCSKISLHRLLKKLKVYFSNDIAKDWLDYCESLLQKSEYTCALLYAIITSIFYIGSDNYKTAFVLKYIPVEPKINHDTIDRKLLNIQQGICKFAHFSRPPVPLECILPYIKGDYVHYCLPMMDSYLNNLPKPQLKNFVVAILNTPVSVQKHALRLAFQCFSLDELTNVLTNVWNTSQNISLRKTIYKALFHNIEIVDRNSQVKLYKTLKMFTLDLHENDDPSVFSLITRFHISEFKDDFLQTIWNMVQTLSDQKSKNINNKCKIIDEITSEISIIDKKFVRTYIIDDLVRSTLIDKTTELYKDNKMTDINKAKWRLVAKYITYIEEIERNLELVQIILVRCTDMWNITDNGIYTSRKFMFRFIDEILELCEADSIPVLEYIVKLLCELLPMQQIYTLYIKLNLIIISKTVIASNRIVEEIAQHVANGVVAFISVLIDRKMFYSSFYREFTERLMYVIRLMNSCLDVHPDILSILVSSHLIEATHHPEVHLIALNLLPTKRPEHCTDIWLDTIRRFRDGDNLELSCYVHQHFVHNRYKEI